MLFVDNVISAFIMLSNERAARARYKAMCTMEDTHERIQKILNTLMPQLVVEEIRELPVNSEPPSHQYASAKEPKEVVEFISDLFGMFDELTDKHSVYKVETVGDAYIAGQAVFPLTLVNKPASVICF